MPFAQLAQSHLQKLAICGNKDVTTIKVTEGGCKLRYKNIGCGDAESPAADEHAASLL